MAVMPYCLITIITSGLIKLLNIINLLFHRNNYTASIYSLLPILRELFNLKLFTVSFTVDCFISPWTFHTFRENLLIETSIKNINGMAKSLVNLAFSLKGL